MLNIMMELFFLMMVIFSLLMCYMVEELIKKVVCFLVSIFLLFFLFSNNSFCYLITLIYIGGLFVLMVFVFGMHYDSLQKSLNFVPAAIFLLLPLSFTHEWNSFLIFWSLLNISIYSVFWIFILFLIVFIMLTFIFLSGKSSRNL